MATLFRYQIQRPAQQLTKEEQYALGARTHVENTTAWFRQVSALYHGNDHPALLTKATTLLSGPQAISNFTQLSPYLRSAVEFCSLKGKNLNQDTFRSRITHDDVGAYFGSRNRVHLRDQQRLEDTILGLAILGKLGDRKNAPLQYAYKVYTLLKRSLASDVEVDTDDIQDILRKPLIIPPFRYRQCEKKSSNGYSDLPILVDTEDGCTCTCKDTACVSQSPCCPELKPYVADLMLLREELACYEAKQLAYIENIMLGEERERVHRNLERTETYSEVETETKKSLEKDLQIEDRFSLKSEIQKTVKQDVSADAGVTLDYELKPIKVTTTANFSYDYSKEESQQIAREYARNIVSRSVTKVEENVRELTSKRRLLEIEETNTHKFSNVNGSEKHIVGQYHFVNMKNKAQVMNYGKRLMFDFVVPEPLQLYKKLLEKPIGPFGPPPIKPLIKPNQISTSPDITRHYTNNTDHGLEGGNTFDPNASYHYLDIIKYFELEGITPLPQITYITTTFQYVKSNGDSSWKMFEPVTLQIPPEYQADYWFTKGGIYLDHGASSCVMVVGTTMMQWEEASQSSFPGFQAEITPRITDSITISFHTFTIEEVNLTVCIELVARDSVAMEWRLRIYDKIMAKYEKDLEAYNIAKARYEQERNAKIPFGRNPFQNREIERTELKRAAISYISCQFFDRFKAMNRKSKPCGYPEMDLALAQKEGMFIQFFEQVLDWNLMTYLFYPYYWGQKCSWPEKIQELDDDPLFEKALSAGAARVQIPVRVGAEALALHWAAYQEIWQGSDTPPSPDDDFFLSMIQEIKEQKSCYYNDRQGSLEVTVGSDTVILSGFSEYYYNPSLIAADIDREIIINFEVYRIVAIESLDPNDKKADWKITLERAYEGKGMCGCAHPEPRTVFKNLKYHTGAVFVGAPFEVTVPTNLVFLRNTKDSQGAYVVSDCLPCYPLDSCD